MEDHLLEEDPPAAVLATVEVVDLQEAGGEAHLQTIEEVDRPMEGAAVDGPTLMAITEGGVTQEVTIHQTLQEVTPQVHRLLMECSPLTLRPN